ncbi:hypothetical protein C8D96_0797 [Kushneria marisflavi]|nr:hypothetical protein C8D96_0797 [Kushneria marisflavi]
MGLNCTIVSAFRMISIHDRRTASAFATRAAFQYDDALAAWRCFNTGSVILSIALLYHTSFPVSQ